MRDKELYSILELNNLVWGRKSGREKKSNSHTLYSQLSLIQEECLSLQAKGKLHFSNTIQLHCNTLNLISVFYNKFHKIYLIF